MTDTQQPARADDEAFEALRETEVAWLAAELGASIANLGYPVGMGIAPHEKTLRAAAGKLFDRYLKMFSLIRSAAQQPARAGELIEKLIEALRPFAAFAEKAESFVDARAKDGGSPILPSRDFRLADFRRAVDALTKAEAASPVEGEQGCRCQQCGENYRVDLLVPDDLWNDIRPRGGHEGAGLLCGSCMFKSIEARAVRRGEFGAVRLIPANKPERVTSTQAGEEGACPKCKGTGKNELFIYEYADDRCEICNGTGKRSTPGAAR